MVVLLRVLVVDMLVLLVREDVLLEVLVVVVSQVAGTCHETETRLEKRRNLDSMRKRSRGAPFRC